MTKIKTVKIPIELFTEAKMLLSRQSYKNSRCCREIVRRLIGSCRTCGELADKYTIEKLDGIEVIIRFCPLHG